MLIDADLAYKILCRAEDIIKIEEWYGERISGINAVVYSMDHLYYQMFKSSVENALKRQRKASKGSTNFSTAISRALNIIAIEELPLITDMRDVSGASRLAVRAGAAVQLAISYVRMALLYVTTDLDRTISKDEILEAIAIAKVSLKAQIRTLPQLKTHAPVALEQYKAEVSIYGISVDKLYEKEAKDKNTKEVIPRRKITVNICSDEENPQ